MGNDKRPVIVMKEDTERERGKNAQDNNIKAACIISDAVKSTLGPSGLDKMLVDDMGDVLITNDGATILKEIDVEHPTAKIIVNVAKSQDEECGDGTSSSVILTGELLKKAKDLLDQDIHPTVVVKGYQLAASKAKEILKNISVSVDINDRESLKNVAKTSMASKSISAEKELLSDIVVKAVTKVAESKDENISIDLDDIKVQKVLGSPVDNTKLVDGYVLDKKRMNESMPSKVDNGKVALIGTSLQLQKTQNDTNINISDPDQLQDLMNKEEKMMMKILNKIKDSGANVVLCKEGVDDFIENKLTKEGIMVVKRVPSSDMKRLSKMLGKTIVKDVSDLTKDDVASVSNVEQKKLGDIDYIFFDDSESDVVTVMLYGTTTHIVDEVERAMHDALFVTKVALEDKSINPGGGAVMVELSKILREYALSVGGREQMAVNAYADALEIIPKTLAENAGIDSIDMLLELRSKHKKGLKYHGVDIKSGRTANLLKANVIEPLRLSLQEVDTSTEAATMILRIDDVIKSKGNGGKQGQPDPRGMMQ